VHAFPTTLCFVGPSALAAMLLSDVTRLPGYCIRRTDAGTREAREQEVAVGSRSLNPPA
jgi:hypothetical protein